MKNSSDFHDWLVTFTILLCGVFYAFFYNKTTLINTRFYTTLTLAGIFSLLTLLIISQCIKIKYTLKIYYILATISSILLTFTSIYANIMIFIFTNTSTIPLILCCSFLILFLVSITTIIIINFS